MFGKDKKILNMVLIVLLLPLEINSQQERHFLHCRSTVMKTKDTLPVFSSVFESDDRRIAHYSDEEGVRKSLSSGVPVEPLDSPDWMRDQFNTLSDCRDAPCSEPHVLQRITGCELEKFPNGSVKSLTAFDEYGFDGEDFMAFDLDSMKWVEKNPKAKDTKLEWDLQTGRNRDIRRFLQTCTDWISTFNNPTESSPHVHVFVPKVSSDQHKLVLSCLATGFYPRDVEMNIRSDQSDTKLEHQISSGIRPNADGSFQMSISVEIDTRQKGIYECHVSHRGLSQTRAILTVWAESPVCVAETCAAALLILILILILIVWFVICIYKKRSKAQSCKKE